MTLKCLSDRKRSARPVLLPLLLVTVAGCLSRPPLVQQSFNFSIPTPKTIAFAMTSRVLEIRQIGIAAPYDSQSFTYRRGPSLYERDPYAQFLVPPAESLAAALSSYLANTGLFRDVVTADSSLKPDTILEAYVSDLYGDFRNQAAPVAMIRIRFRVFEARNGVAGKLLLEREYTQQVPFEARTAAGLMGGWNTALKQLLAGFTRDLQKALPRQQAQMGSIPQWRDSAPALRLSTF